MTWCLPHPHWPAGSPSRKDSRSSGLLAEGHLGVGGQLHIRAIHIGKKIKQMQHKKGKKNKTKNASRKDVKRGRWGSGVCGRQGWTSLYRQLHTTTPDRLISDKSQKKSVLPISLRKRLYFSPSLCLSWGLNHFPISKTSWTLLCRNPTGV